MSDQRVLMIESPCHISVDTGRILFKRADGHSKTELADDLAVLCLHHEQISISHHALRALHQANCAIITTDAQHMPCGVMHPLSLQASSIASTRLKLQISLEFNPERKNALWQSIVSSKIANSAHVLRLLKLNGAIRLERLSQTVRLGDKQNAEGQAAKYYWQLYFAQSHLAEYSRRRIKQGAEDAINARLNYGYAILRAMIARELIIAGLNPILGVGHDNQGNPYNLADDLIEPFRCVAEYAIARIDDFERPFIGEEKKKVLQLMQCEFYLSHDEGNQYRLAQAIAQMVKSYCQTLSSIDKPIRLKLPHTMIVVNHT